MQSGAQMTWQNCRIMSRTVCVVYFCVQVFMHALNYAVTFMRFSSDPCLTQLYHVSILMDMLHSCGKKKLQTWHSKYVCVCLSVCWGRLCVYQRTEGLHLAPGASLLTAGTNLNAGLTRISTGRREHEVNRAETTGHETRTQDKWEY